MSSLQTTNGNLTDTVQHILLEFPYIRPRTVCVNLAGTPLLAIETSALRMGDVSVVYDMLGQFTRLDKSHEPLQTMPPREGPGFPSDDERKVSPNIYLYSVIFTRKGTIPISQVTCEGVDLALCETDCVSDNMTMDGSITGINVYTGGGLTLTCVEHYADINGPAYLLELHLRKDGTVRPDEERETLG
jgi:hypothetical protein